MPDGTKIALDVLLPQDSVDQQDSATKHPTVFIQCRYMRGAAARWPFNLLSGHRPVDLINQDLKLGLVRAGYAVVSIDVRGTGVSLVKGVAEP